MGTAAPPASRPDVQFIIGRAAEPAKGTQAARPASGASTRSPSDSGKRAATNSDHAVNSHIGDDSDRVQILKQELANEARALEGKQRLLSLPSAETDPLVTALRDRLQQEVLSHERNISALHRELDRTRAGSP